MPRYIEPKNGGVTLLVVSYTFLPLTVITVLLRIWARRLKKTTLQLNDYAIIIGSILAVGNTILTILAVIYGGVGQHLIYVLPAYPTLAKITLALAIVWTIANTAVKVSILHLYIVIFQNQKFKYSAFFALFLTGGYAITNVVQNLLTCRPVAFNWDKTIPGGKCSSAKSPFLASAIINMSIDIIIVIMPMPMLWSLQMNTKRKIALTGIFGIGALICVLSAVRIHAIATLDYEDFSYSVVPDGIYSVLEPCLGVINACLPVLQPIVNKLTNNTLFSTGKRSMGASSSRVQSAKDLTTRSGRHRAKLFRRLDEVDSIGNDEENLFPLSEIESPKLTSEKNGRTRAVVTSKSTPAAPKEQIEITTAWSVNSRGET